MLRREIRRLKEIARSIDEHAEMGQPYSLTFYFDEKEPLTQSQREKLESYLSYHFHEVWAKTWLYLESDEIRRVIGIPPIHNTGAF